MVHRRSLVGQEPPAVHQPQAQRPVGAGDLTVRGIEEDVDLAAGGLDQTTTRQVQTSPNGLQILHRDLELLLHGGTFFHTPRVAPEDGKRCASNFPTWYDVGVKRLPRLALVTLLALATAPPLLAAQPARQHLTVLHTSDIHGSVLPFDDARNRPADGSLAQVATLVKEIREKAHDPVLLLDSGDTIQGTPLEQFVDVRWGEPSPTIAAMNAMGYQAMAVGNHEFNFGLEVLRRAERQAHFPFLSANSVEAATGEP
ncbi:MAG TPA: hypothetical protein ENK19_05040, partial [Acidobacteria bacterium]|nr:hypothetical protein [Acidobacteriota bacterium]